MNTQEKYKHIEHKYAKLIDNELFIEFNKNKKPFQTETSIGYRGFYEIALKEWQKETKIIKFASNDEARKLTIFLYKHFTYDEYVNLMINGFDASDCVDIKDNLAYFREPITYNMKFSKPFINEIVSNNLNIDKLIVKQTKEIEQHEYEQQLDIYENLLIDAYFKILELEELNNQTLKDEQTQTKLMSEIISIIKNYKGSGTALFSLLTKFKITRRNHG